VSKQNEWLTQQLADLAAPLAALTYALEHQLVDLDPWELFTSDDRMKARSDAVNGRYLQRKVLCFAQRRDTDDVACIIIGSQAQEKAGDILIVHDFATLGSEVDAGFSDFWDWFRAAVEDMIDTFRHLGDRYES
jgi:hypothetical protein